MEKEFFFYCVSALGREGSGKQDLLKTGKMLIFQNSKELSSPEKLASCKIIIKRFACWTCNLHFFLKKKYLIKRNNQGNFHLVFLFLVFRFSEMNRHGNQIYDAMYFPASFRRRTALRHILNIISHLLLRKLIPVWDSS